MNSNNGNSPISGAKIVFGSILVILGVLILGFNFHIIPDFYWDYIMTWQILLILIGLIMLFGRSGKITGLILIISGIIFYIPIFTGYNVNFFKIAIPIILIIIGSSLLFKRKRSIPSPKTYRGVSGVIDETAIFSGSEIFFTEDTFKGGTITAIFGGYHLDLTKTNLPLGTTYLEITAIFGGVEIVVPEKWKVTSKVTGIFGAFEDKRYNKLVNDPERELVITGTAIFGGGELKAH